MKVAFSCVEGVERFSVCAADGSDVSVEKGKNFSTADPKLIAELDGAPHAVKRAKGEAE